MKIRRRIPAVDYVRITKENIDKAHICCAMPGKQGIQSDKKFLALAGIK